MNNFPEGLPVVVAEYLRSAATMIAKEQDFKLSSPDELKLWLEANADEIATKALALQHETLNKLNSPEGEKVKKLMGIKIWTEFRQRDLIAESNAAIEKIIGS
ncbi:MAG: hypothetical protein MH252_07665 [Thermosynechococcaceae cyanobacterium MS004]|nr:hypothetical protein [Thermosynechococcaceae cyanobacterium MS004]